MFCYFAATERAVYHSRFELEYDIQLDGTADAFDCVEQYRQVISDRLVGVAENLGAFCTLQVPDFDVTLTPETDGMDLNIRVDGAKVFANVTFSAQPTRLPDTTIESCIDLFAVLFRLWSPPVENLRNLDLADVCKQTAVNQM